MLSSLIFVWSICRSPGGESSAPLTPLWRLLFVGSNGTAGKMNGALEHSEQPDPDAIKMFVGQIPRSWSEKELKELFEPFGAVYQINILRDRSQNPPQSKGTARNAAILRSGLLVLRPFCTAARRGAESNRTARSHSVAFQIDTKREKLAGK